MLYEKDRHVLHVITLKVTGKSPQILMKLIEIFGTPIQYRQGFLVSFICETHVICTVLYTDFGLILSLQNP